MTKFKTLGGGVGIIALTWGCSSNVQIGHGDAGGQAGQVGQGGSQTAGSAGLAEGGGISTGGSKAGTGGAGGSVSAGAGGSAGSGGDTGFPPDPPQQSADKLDLLFVVDNSMSMEHHQALLAQSVGSFLRRLENPLCLEPNGTPSSTQPAGPADSCPAGAEREFPAVRDVHIGVITSSLGARGGQICVDATGDDRAQLLPSVRPGLSSYDGQGFLKWDPDATATPAGETDLDAIAADLTAHIGAANTIGCGYEHSLEAWYQFLVDPEPTTNITAVNNVSVPTGINQTVLEQRAAFLRPDSAVAVIVLSDENDCSIVGESVGWLIGLSQAGGSPFTMPRSTQACQTDINSPCCRSCATAESEPPPGCTTLGVGTNDPECMKNNGMLDNSLNEDHLNLRCFDQKRRFGFDVLYPIERYTAGLTHKTVPNRQGAQVRNPLFTTTRNPTLINFALIAGVPWQNISVDPPGEDISYLTAEELTAQGRWPLILGDPANDVPPTDPLMRESPNERTGTSPLLGAALVPSSSQDPTANPANGHEQTNVASDDLQYSCIYELPTPVPCNGPECECGPGTESRNRPVCQPPGGGPAGNTQYYAKAYPPTRGLALARSLGKQAVLGSICPRNAADAVAPDYAYSAEFNSLARRLGVMLVE